MRRRFFAPTAPEMVVLTADVMAAVMAVETAAEMECLRLRLLDRRQDCDTRRPKAGTPTAEEQQVQARVPTHRVQVDRVPVMQEARVAT